MYLIICEVLTFWNRDPLREEFGVDRGVSELHLFRMNISFLTQECDGLNLDMTDNMGHVFIGQELGVTKHRIIQNRFVPYVEAECLPCHAAPSGCCNSCQALRQAYRRAGLPVETTRDLPQCDQGCNVALEAKIFPSRGSIRYVPGRAHREVDSGFTDYSFNVQDLYEAKWNPSHIVHGLEFAPLEEPMAQLARLHLPLAGKRVDIIGPPKRVEYEVFFVPTDLVLPDKTLHTHQYSAAYTEASMIEYDAATQKPVMHGVPGFLFNYRFQPFRVRQYYTSEGYGRLVLSLLFLLGGSMALLDLFDSVVFRLFRKGSEKA